MKCILRGQQQRGVLHQVTRLLSTKPVQALVSPKRKLEVEGIETPTWSVNELLASYPAPSLSSSTLIRLHKTSALLPPPESSTEFNVLKGEMEELVKLVEAVKLVDASAFEADGRVWPKDVGIQGIVPTEEDAGATGKHPDILRHAAKTVDDFYVVELPTTSKMK